MPSAVKDVDVSGYEEVRAMNQVYDPGGTGHIKPTHKWGHQEGERNLHNVQYVVDAPEELLGSTLHFGGSSPREEL